MDYQSLLNPNQLKAVTTESQFVRIIAGAGSGKTRVLTYRISYLISERNVDPRRILAIAFTNKVAKEMQDRAIKLVDHDAPFLRIFTFHAFCSRLLREDAGLIGYKTNFTIFDEDDQASLVKDIAKDEGYKKGDAKVKEFLHFIRYNKGKGLYPDDLVSKVKADQRDALKIYRMYEDKKEAMYAFDFDDLLLKAIEILQNDEPTRLKWQRRFDHILVDEFQDTNDIQYVLMKLLSRESTSIYVVGDPDQTIYTWRGANQKIILDFEKDHPGCETIILNENYRSTKTILDAANKLIKNNKKRVPKDLFTNAPDGAKIESHRAYKFYDEADWVVRQIKSIVKENGGDYKTIAVLYRSSYITRPFENKLAEYAIPYKIFGGLRFYQRMEVKDVLSYFRLLTNELDDVAFDRIVNVPKRKIGAVTLETIKREAGAQGKSEYQYIKDVELGQTDVSPKAILQLKELIQKMEKVKEKLSANLEAYSTVLRDFITDIGYYKYLAETETIEEDRIGNVNALFDDVNSFITAHPESTFEEYLQNVALFTSQDEINDGNYVSLMTIHVAKGLEFDNVFIIGLNEGTFPSSRSVNESGDSGMEEERRLAYVAITRARKRLFMSCNQSYSFQTDSNSSPSCFFKEAGVDIGRKQNATYWEDGSGWGKRNDRYSDFFDDGDSILPFDDVKEVPSVHEEPQTNGVDHWEVGDLVTHEKFGDGVVRSVLSDSIIVVEFEQFGKKTLVSTHKMLSKRNGKVGKA